MLRFLPLLAACTLVAAPAFAQGSRILLPTIPGFHTLKGDLHLHTVFSDGYVWPSFRVYEANRDGLDFIALTDHIDYEGNPKELERDYNKAFDLAVAAAEGTRLIVLRGGEISPRTPPYHANAIFLQDANALPTPYMSETKGSFVMKSKPTNAELMAPFIEAKNQGALIIYNHPAYLYDWDETTMGADLMTSFHRSLLQQGMLHGIEVVNSERYYKKAHRIAMEHNLTLIAGSDEHSDIANTHKTGHRPMTLVFSKDSTAAGIREAMLARRTAIYFKDFIIGRKAEIEPFFKSAITATAEQSRRHNEPLLLVHLANGSDLPFTIRASGKYDIDNLPLGRLTLPPRTTTTIAVRTLWDFPPIVTIPILVENLMTGPDEVLDTSIAVRHDWKR